MLIEIGYSFGEQWNVKYDHFDTACTNHCWSFISFKSYTDNNQCQITLLISDFASLINSADACFIINGQHCTLFIII